MSFPTSNELLMCGCMYCVFYSFSKNATVGSYARECVWFSVSCLCSKVAVPLCISICRGRVSLVSWPQSRRSIWFLHGQLHVNDAFLLFSIMIPWWHMRLLSSIFLTLLGSYIFILQCNVCLLHGPF